MRALISLAAFFVILTVIISGGCGSSSHTPNNTPTPTATPTPTPISTPPPKFLYALGYTQKQVYGYSINPSTGALTSLGSATSSGMTTNDTMCGNDSYLYIPGLSQLGGFSINSSTGALSAISGLPTSPTGASGLYQCAVTPNGSYLYVTDSSGNLYGYSIGSGGALSAISGMPFAESGTPHGIAVDSTGKYLLVGLSQSSELDVFAIGSSGTLSRVTGSPFSTNGGGDYIAITPSDAFVYAGESGFLSTLAFDNSTGTATYKNQVAYQNGNTTPRVYPGVLVIDAQSQFLYSADGSSNNIDAFSINPTTGALTGLSGAPLGSGYKSPLASALDPSNKFYYIADYSASASSIYIWDFNSTTGALTNSTSVSVGADAIASIVITHQ